MGLDIVTPGGGDLEFISKHTATGTTSLEVDNLDLDSDLMYFVTWTLEDVSGVNNTVSLYYFNESTTATDYYVGYTIHNGASTSGARVNSAAILNTLNLNEQSFHYAYIVRDPDGYPRCSFYGSKRAPSTVSAYHGTHVYNNSSNITGIRITSNQANGLDGTLKVYKVNE